MKRRQLLASGGILATLSGCLHSITGGGTETKTTPETKQSTDTTTSSSGGEWTPPSGPFDDPNPDDGYAPEFDDVPPSPNVDVDSLETIQRNGETIRLLPVTDAVKWWARREARFADARGQTQYDHGHIVSAVLSTAQSSINGPVADWPTDDRIVCYCGCPHHLSSIRASELQKAGYTDVYVIDEGYGEWKNRNYPIAGSGVENRKPNYIVRGLSAERYAGKMAWARHEPSGQIEAAPIQSDGSFELHCKFTGLSPSSTLTIETPGYTVRASVETVTTKTVTADLN